MDTFGPNMSQFAISHQEVGILDGWIHTYCVREDIISGLKANVKWHITKEEEIAMKELLSDDRIVIQ